MAVTNTGVVLRTITGVNESDLFLDSEATSVTTNTGIVERSIVGVHDANFVRPLGDEEVSNSSFDIDSDWTLGSGWTISGGLLNASGVISNCFQSSSFILGKTYKVTYSISNYVSGLFRVTIGSGGFGQNRSSNGTFTENTVYSGANFLYLRGTSSFTGSIDNVSVKEVLVNRESTATNTGIVERSLTGVNESDPMFPDNTISTITNI
jgi:hypothetical protein